MARRLIDADKLKRHYAWWQGGTREMTMDEAKHDFDVIVDLQPTVEPRKGKWVFMPVKYWGASNCKCSECGEEEFVIQTKPYKYCRWCGARMEIDE